MEMTIKLKSLDFLNTLIGKPLLYAIKSPDIELYDFGFGDWIERVNRHGKNKKIGTHTLHILCRFKVICRSEDCRIDRYYEDTPHEEFHSEIGKLLGLKVKGIALSDKNDLWLDLGDFWVVFATFEDGEESWRFFTFDKNAPHLVASDRFLEFIE